MELYGMLRDVSLRTQLLLVVLLMTTTDISALKAVTVIVPQAVNVGDTVTLQCRYDLEGEDLYMVKWYKGTKEFYRYIPKELPSTQLFPLQGIDVDLSKSSPKEVVLRNVQPDISGKYLCEVSSDAPNFYTHLVSGYMYVVAVPDGDPELNVEKDMIEVGYTLRGNCTSPASYPPANITLFLNGKRVNVTSLARLPPPNVISADNRRKPMISVAGVELEIDSNTFQNGKARLKCVANIFSLYRKEAEVVLDEDRPKPRPSSVLGTRDAVSGASVIFSLCVSPFLLVIATLR